MAKNNHKDVWDAIRELRDSQKHTDEQLGYLGNSQGYLVEGLIAPAISDIFGVKQIYRRAKGSLNGSNMEVDAIGIKKDLVVVTEIKSRLDIWFVDYLLEKLPKFVKFFPEYKGRKIIGAVGGINIDKDVGKYAERKGLYVLVPSGDTMKLANKKSFKPRYF